MPSHNGARKASMFAALSPNDPRGVAAALRIWAEMIAWMARASYQ
jgi:hypothetical protein